MTEKLTIENMISWELGEEKAKNLGGNFEDVKRLYPMFKESILKNKNKTDPLFTPGLFKELVLFGRTKIPAQYATLLTRNRMPKIEIGYQGFLSLLLNGGKADYVKTAIVNANDTFQVSRGTETKVTHVTKGMPELYFIKDMEGGGDLKVEDILKRQIVRFPAYYCLIKVKDVDEPHLEVMTGNDLWVILNDTDIVRNAKSSSARGKVSPWVNYFGEMARKTVFRRAIKMLGINCDPMILAAEKWDNQGYVF